MFIDPKKYQELLSSGKLEEILRGSEKGKGLVIGNPKVGQNFESFKKTGKKYSLDIRNEDILVVPDITVTDAPYLQRNSIHGIVTDRGTCIGHGAILCMYFEIAFVVGTINSTNLLKEYDRILIDGEGGRIYRVKEV